MKAKLFDAHNKFVSDHEIAEASPTIQLRELGATKVIDREGGGFCAKFETYH